MVCVVCVREAENTDNIHKQWRHRTCTTHDEVKLHYGPYLHVYV